MLISRSIAASVSEAIETTFDGQHPCPMCSAIADGKQSEQQSEQNLDLLKKAGDMKFLELASVELDHEFLASRVFWPALQLNCFTRVEAPPTPPPLA